MFLYVYDVQIRKAMNSTHREVVMKDNQELLPVTADTQELIQYYTTEEKQLVGLGVRMDLGENFAGEGLIHAEVYDVTGAATFRRDRPIWRIREACSAQRISTRPHCWTVSIWA